MNSSNLAAACAALALLIALPAPAATSDWVGNGSINPSNSVDTVRDCDTGYTLMGFDVRYGAASQQLGVGRLRGVCRKINQDGQHNMSIAARYTEWTNYSWNHASTRQIDHLAQSRCPVDMVIRSFIGRTNSNGAYIHALRFSCKQVDASNLSQIRINDSGNHQAQAAAGYSDQGNWQTPWRKCPNRELATGFEVRAHQTLSRLRMRCGTPGVHVEAPGSFQLTAPGNGQNFSPTLSYSWTPAARAQSYMVAWLSTAQLQTFNPVQPDTATALVGCYASPCTPSLTTAQRQAIDSVIDAEDRIFAKAVAVDIVGNRTLYTQSTNFALLNPPAAMRR